ncbi:MAG: hypothetical protein LPK46_09470 [Bacteroidota bacterium]|nr:hypothetical protein [Bacteroidota bacterium]MDX5506353.1 hypothetical protein [Bacteroidota bacterium]
MQKILKENGMILIILFFITSAAAYAIAKYILPQEYRSVAVIFPPNTHANIHLVSAGMRFGYDKEIGEHVEILNSNPVRESIIDTFDLIAHYSIDTTDPFFREELGRRYDRNIDISRTVNKSIHISVFDRDPQIAASMANALIREADRHKTDMIRGNIALAMHAARNSLEEKETTVEEMTDSLEALRQAGESVWTFGEERKSGRYMNYELQYRRELERFHNLKARYEELEDLYNEAIPRSYVVSPAVASVKPDRPKKLIIALASGFLAILIFIGYKSLKEDE